MATSLSEDLLQKFFKQYPSQSLATNAKFWNLPEIPTYQTIHLSGDLQLNLNGSSKRFEDGAFVYQKTDGRLDALPSSSASGGGITVDGAAVRPVVDNWRSGYTDGNMANLTYNQDSKVLRLAMPERAGGMSIRYPAPTPQQMVDLAERSGAVMQARTSDGKIIEGFFTSGKGGVLPTDFSTFHNGINLNGGEFLSISRNQDGSLRGLFAYKPYTEKEIEQVTGFGKYSLPGNDVRNLKTLDGKALSIDASPSLNVETERATIPRKFVPAEIDQSALRQHFLDQSVLQEQLRQRMLGQNSALFGELKPIDETAIRDAAARSFDEKIGSEVGQRQLLSQTDELLRSNAKLADYLAGKDGLAAGTAELSIIRTPGLIEGTQNSLLDEAVSTSEKGLGRILGPGRTAAIFGLTLVGTAVAAAGVDYLLQRDSAGASASERTSLPDLGINLDAGDSQRLKGDIYSKAVQGSVEKSASGAAASASDSPLANAERLLHDSGQENPAYHETKPVEQPHG